jgi:hypothetical protein
MRFTRVSSVPFGSVRSRRVFGRVPALAGLCRLLLPVVFPAPSSCRAGNGALFRFGSCDYSATATFTAACPPESALGACFYFMHVQGFLACPSLTMSRLSEGPRWRMYRFAYNYIVYRCTLDIKYVMRDDGSQVRYDMIQSRTSNPAFPAMVDLSGSYTIEKRSGREDVCVTYEQKARMSKKLNVLYTTEIRWRTNGVLRRLKAYLQRMGEKDQ